MPFTISHVAAILPIVAVANRPARVRARGRHSLGASTGGVRKRTTEHVKDLERPVGPVFVGVWVVAGFPGVVAGEVDVFPAEWREVLEQIGVDGLLGGDGSGGSFGVDGVPGHDCCGGEVEAGCSYRCCSKVRSRNLLSR